MQKFSAKASSENPTKTIVKARDFTITIDEPQKLGGTNDGANPVEYVLAALAGCLNVVGHKIAGEMGIDLNKIDFELEGDLDPARFIGKTTESRAGYQEIRVRIQPETDEDKETLEKWLEAIEERCPVSDNLNNATPVILSLT